MVPISEDAPLSFTKEGGELGELHVGPCEVWCSSECTHTAWRRMGFLRQRVIFSQALVLQRTSKPFLKAVWFLEGLIQWCNRGGYRGKGLVRVKQYQTIMSGEKRSAN